MQHSKDTARPSGNNQPRKNWPRQPPPTANQVKVWQRYLSANFLRYTTKWEQRLGPVQPNTYENYKRWKDSNTSTTFGDPRNYDTLKKYIRALPTWYSRLLTNYKQVATHIQIWKAFRRKDTTIDIASDGGFANAIGTFGWKIVAILRQKEQVL